MQNEYNELPELVPQALIDEVKALSPAQLCDGMKGLGIAREGCMDAGIMAVGEKERFMIGTAYTVDTENGDNFPIHVAIYNGKPGYVIIVSGKGYDNSAYMGDLMGSAAEAIGLSGIVVDGYVRDKLGLGALEMPIYARGIMQRGPSKKGPGRINVPVQCAGVAVGPGDLVVGDNDGVTVVPRDRIVEVIAAAKKKDAYEVKRRAAIAEYRACKANGSALPDLTPEWVKEMQQTE